MQKQVFFHQYRRPRFNNPTFVSNNVNSSLTFFNPHNTKETFQKQNVRYQSTDHKNIHNNKDYQQPNPYLSSKNQREPTTNIYNQQRSNQNRPSNLSSYGSTSLSLNQKDIYNKQNSNFNIITMKPKQYDISIRQHPRLTLQNKDEMYYQRMVEQMKKKAHSDLFYQRKNVGHLQNNTYENKNVLGDDKFIAGKYTYDKDKFNKSKLLNNPEAQKNQLQNYKSQRVKNNQYFTPKLLNSMDELISLS